jgi:glucuronate isomerase
LQAVTSHQVVDLDTYEAAIVNRLTFFDEFGCLLSDHSLDSGFTYTICNASTAASIFKKVLEREALSNEQMVSLQSYLLHFLGTEYAKRKWKMQLHIGAYRYTSSVLRSKVGPAGGYACIGSTADVQSLCLFSMSWIKKVRYRKLFYTL